jgi:hypothetical protein
MGNWFSEWMTGTLANGFALILWLVVGVVAVVILAKFGKWIAGAAVVLIIGAVLVMSSYSSASQARATSAVAQAAARGGMGTGGVVVTTVLATLLCVVSVWGAWQYRQRQKAKGQAGGVSLPGLGSINPEALQQLVMLAQLFHQGRGQVQPPPPTVVVVNGDQHTGKRQSQEWEPLELVESEPLALTDDAGGFVWGQ